MIVLDASAALELLLRAADYPGLVDRVLLPILAGRNPTARPNREGRGEMRMSDIDAAASGQFRTVAARRTCRGWMMSVARPSCRSSRIS